VIVLFGATGYTGRLVAAELARRGAEFVLAGRDRDRLRQVSAAVAGGAPVEVAALEDPASLRALLADQSVLISCAGPFTKLGEPLVRAAVETGTHYLDSTGEQRFMRIVFDRYGEAAARAGVALVPAMGFDYAPGDAIARLTCEAVEPVGELLVAYSIEWPGMSRGTVASVLEILSGDEVGYSDREWRALPPGWGRERIAFPDPVGPRTVVAYPAGEVLTVPRHSDVRTVRALMDTRAFAPRALAPLVPAIRPAAARVLRSRLRGPVERLVAKLPEGPTLEARQAAEFRVLTRARGADDGSAQGGVRGRDPYGLTARLLAWGAEQMALPGYDRCGAIGPAAAFDPAELLDDLADLDVSWSLDGDRSAIGAFS
jgi:short subunit dehydrogenase-like uncharacterized protein